MKDANNRFDNIIKLSISLSAMLKKLVLKKYDGNI